MIVRGQSRNKFEFSALTYDRGIVTLNSPRWRSSLWLHTYTDPQPKQEGMLSIRTTSGFLQSVSC